jgi:hypothetical protein
MSGSGAIADALPPRAIGLATSLGGFTTKHRE